MQDYYNELEDIIERLLKEKGNKDYDTIIKLAIEELSFSYGMKQIDYVYCGTCWVIAFVDEDHELGLYTHSLGARSKQTKENPFE